MVVRCGEKKVELILWLLKEQFSRSQSQPLKNWHWLVVYCDFCSCGLSSPISPLNTHGDAVKGKCKLTTYCWECESLWLSVKLLCVCQTHEPPLPLRGAVIQSSYLTKDYISQPALFSVGPWASTSTEWSCDSEYHLDQGLHFPACLVLSGTMWFTPAKGKWEEHSELECLKSRPSFSTFFLPSLVGSVQMTLIPWKARGVKILKNSGSLYHPMEKNHLLSGSAIKAIMNYYCVKLLCLEVCLL